MSFLFCSWAKNDEEKVDDEEDEEEEDQDSSSHLKDAEKIYNEALKKKTEHVSPIKEPAKRLEPLTNGNSIPREEEKEKPFFVMWKKPEEEESEREESDDEINKSPKTSPPPSPIKEPSEKKLPDKQVELEEKSPTENGIEEKSSSMFAHVVWKDPNKEDEYITSSSSEEEEEEEDLQFNQADPIRNIDNEKTETNNCNGENTVKDDGDDDLFDSIAKSVSKNMTTLFCKCDKKC